MVTEINGKIGYYDNKVKDDSVRYGRNAVDNHKSFVVTPMSEDVFNPAPILDFMPGSENENVEKLEKFINENDKYLKSLPPIEYEYRYMPDNKVDVKALLGSAYEELGVKEMPIDEFESKYLISNSMTAKPLDVNGDGKIDVAECGANILAADILSKGAADIEKVNGTINSKGFNAILEYSKKSNAEAAKKLYSDIYNRYDLYSAYKDFLSDEDNTIK